MSSNKVSNDYFRGFFAQKPLSHQYSGQLNYIAR